MLPILIASETEESLLSLLQERGLTDSISRINTYIIVPEEDSISISQVRDLASALMLQDTVGAVIIKRVECASPAALQALLKTVEDHHERMPMILWTTALHALPDTLLSRCSVIVQKQRKNPFIPENIRQVMDMLLKYQSYPQLLSYEGVQDLDRQGAENFFTGCISYIHEKITDTPRLSTLGNILLDAYQTFHIFNLNPQMAVDSTVLRMKRAINNIYAT